MPRLPKGKRLIQAYIDEEIYRRFYKLVKDKYEGLRGGLSAEIQEALRHWLDLHDSSAHVKTHMNPGMPRAQLKVDAIIRWLREHGVTLQFTPKEWEMACINTVGSDPRTIRKYLKLAERFGRVKHVVGSVWEIV